MRRIHLLWRGLWPSLALLLTLTALVACGSHGTAPPLTSSAHATLTPTGGGQPIAMATFTSLYATRVVPYYKGVPVPYTGAPVAVQLRKDSCGGPILAPLTAGAPSDITAGASAPLVVRQSPQGGVVVNIAPSASLWITVLARNADPKAAIVACGHPLSEKRQYFDLYDASKGEAGIAFGTALTDPVLASQLDLTFSKPVASGQVHWSVRAESCTGTEIASGAYPANAPQKGVIFASADTAHWWLTVSADSVASGVACGKVH